MNNENELKYKKENEQLLKLFNEQLLNNSTNKYNLSKNLDESASSISQKFQRILKGTCKLNTLHKLAEDLGCKIVFTLEKREVK